MKVLLLSHLNPIKCSAETCYNLQVLSNDDPRYGYNAARNCYEDLMAAGIMDPTKVSEI